MLGILVLDKPAGVTSHDLVNQMRRRFQTRRVGHAGTLDPMATGVLVVAIGPATRFLQYLDLEPKVYESEFAFGTATNTQDAEGEVIESAPVPDDLEERLIQTIPESFVGEIQQIPPMYSAVKRDGKALYQYARAGVELEREPRTVYIHGFDLDRLAPDRIRTTISCSGGTYVRTLAHDLGHAVGTCAHLAKIRRTQCGRFDLSHACTVDDAGPDHLIPLAQALEPMPSLTLNAGQVDHIRHGRAITAGRLEPGVNLFALLDEKGEVISVARRTGPMLQPECVLLAEATHGAS